MTKRPQPSARTTTALTQALRYRDGVPKDLQRARKLMETAANGGIPEAMCALGDMILARPRNSADREVGLGWLRRAARGGVFSAPHKLGRAAENRGDWTTAERWYGRAIELGDFVSGDRLAWHYLDQMDVRCHKKGVAILRRTIAKAREHERSFPGPTMQLAECYLQGLGVKKSEAKGRRLLERVARWAPTARLILRRLDRRAQQRKRQARRSAVTK
jgi:TPR repeat protein